MKTFDSEMLTNFKQRKPKVPFSQAPKQAKTWKKLFFQKLVDVLESNVLNKSINQNLERLTDTLKKLLACLSACVQGVFGCFFSTFVDISESNILVLSVSRNLKMIVIDV